MAETRVDSVIRLFGMTIFRTKEFDDVKGPSMASKIMKEEEGEDEDEEEKLTKPDKILPCPRCNSLETKFCYFNNYSVNQPRHFCRNCQRYWTAGGTMRNVPIGAGRRKNKLIRIQEPANLKTAHLMKPILHFSQRGEGKEEPIAPFVYQCNQVLESSDHPNRFLSNGSMTPLQIMPMTMTMPMPCWVWTLGGESNMNMQHMVGFDMGMDKNGSSCLGKHLREDDDDEQQHNQRRKTNEAEMKNT